MANGNGFSPSGNHLGVNLAFTRFLFVVSRDDDAVANRIRTAGGLIARGFFNDFDADGTREAPPHETIHFFVTENPPEAGATGLLAARYAVQVSGKYRPRLLEVEMELRRRLGDAAEVLAIEGAERNPRYTSLELYDSAYRKSMPRKSGRVARRAFVLPMSKSAEWWEKPALDRHTYFYPHTDQALGCPVSGHAKAAQAGVSAIFRRLFHNPDGYGRSGEFDFVTYFECADDQVDTFDGVCASLRDTAVNPEWQFVTEGPLWRGVRVLKW